MKIIKVLFLLLGMSCFDAGATEVAPAESGIAAPDYSDTLFGDCGSGKRSAAYAKGYDWQIIYKLDLMSKISEPNTKTYGLDNLDIKLSLDGEKIGGFKGTSGLLYILSNHGGKPALKTDRLPHGMDNIETPYNANTTKLYQAWVQQTLLDDRVSVLAGLYDLNSEFYATESSSIFIHPTFGIGAEKGITGQNGPSIFPTTSFGIRVKAKPVPGYYVQAVTLDGVPGDPNNPHGTHVQFNKGDGALNVIEAAMPLSASENAHDNKLALGFWRYTIHYDDVLDVDLSGMPIKRISRGYYAIIEKVLGYKTGGKEESIRSFVRAGKNDGNTAQFDMAWSTGLVFSDPFLGQDQNVFGIAFAQERNGEKYRIASSSTVANEKSFELTYRYQAMHGLVLQPEVQYLLNHSNDPVQNKTWWLGMRFEATF